MEIKDITTYIYHKVISVTSIGDISIENIITYFFIVAFVFIVEFFIVGWNNSAVKKIITFEKSTKNDFFFWLFQLFNVYYFIAFFLSLGICYYLVGFIQRAVQLDLAHYINNVYLQFIVIYIAGDLKNYISHRFFHSSKSLWTLHAFHHSATSFSILTRYRGHFLEMSINRFFDIIPFVLLGAPIQVFFAVKILSEIHQLFLHSNVTSSWSLLGKYILVSPAAHRIHHSDNIEHHNKNFGSTFIFWDRMFNTYFEPKKEVLSIGIQNNPYNKKGVIYDIYLVLKLFIKRTTILLRSSKSN